MSRTRTVTKPFDDSSDRRGGTRDLQSRIEKAGGRMEAKPKANRRELREEGHGESHRT